MYNVFVHNPILFEKNNMLYHFHINNNELVIGQFYSIACGTEFIFTSANYSLESFLIYLFPLFFRRMDLDKNEEKYIMVCNLK